MGDKENRLELATMIGALRDSLEAAQDAGRGRDLQFQVNSIEVEATIEVAKEREGTGGVKFWVIEAGGELSTSRISTQKIRLSLRTDPGTKISRPGSIFPPEEFR